MSNEGFILVSEELGVFIGTSMGLAFWSKLDPAGQEYAPVFPDSKTAWDFVHSWDNIGVDDLRLVSIQTAEPHYASALECGRAGAHNWLNHN